MPNLAIKLSHLIGAHENPKLTGIIRTCPPPGTGDPPAIEGNWPLGKAR